VLAWLCSRVRDWVVMTDELQYAKLATHIGETLSPLPTLRGAHVGAYAQLYPALIAPFYGTMSAPDAFRWAHVLNGIVFASATIPVYLLARHVDLPRPWALACAALSVATLWNLQAAFLMTEAAAYPAFAWAVLAIVRAVEAPSAAHDAVAVAGVAFAVLARTQFLSLGLVLVVAALVHRRHGHRLLWIATAAAVVVALVGGTRILGNYATTAHGFPFPWRAFEQAGAHLDVIGVGLFVLPLLVGGAWLVSRRTAFSITALTTIVVLTLETSSYDARFGGGLADIRSRYLFYIAPLLLIATACALRERRLNARALAAVTVFAAVTVLAHGFPRVAGLYVDAPHAVLNGVIRDSGGRAFVAVAFVVAALVLVRVPRRVRVAVVAVVVAAGCVSASALAWTRLLQSRSPSSRRVDAAPTVVLDWIDSVVPKNAHVGIVPFATNPSWGPNALLWWDAEFWNRTVDRAFVVGANWDYAPFPHTELRVDPQTGVVAGTEHAPEYVAVALDDSRLGLVGASVGVNYGIAILHMQLPYRVAWTSSGLDPDGWSVPGRVARVHVIGGGSAKVTYQDANGKATTICRRGDIALPDAQAGVEPATPLGPTAAGTRGVGVRLTGVAVRASCAG